MRLGGIVAAAWAAVVVGGCGLGLGGLGDSPGSDAGGLPDGVPTVDGTLPGDDGAAPEGSSDDAEEAGPLADALAESSATDSPAPPPVDAGCPGVLCNGSCTAATDCHGCGGANLLCPATNTCTTDCTACLNSPIQCFACDVNRANPIGTCQPNDAAAYCLDTNYDTAYEGGAGTHCKCMLASDCPGDTQVCIAVGNATPPVFGCFTCGEAFTDTFSCKTGPGMAKCVAKMATCH
ncbi:MAG TPA: hypothetical protein VGL81_26390 [Polyangiaceae bacterium]|jgi:hypothetical protein